MKTKNIKDPIKSSSSSLKDKLKFIEKIQNIPAMSVVVVDLITKLNSPNITFSELEKSILLDPALVAYILKIINAPFFGLRKEVLTISKALLLLGIKSLHDLLISYGTQKLYLNLEDKKTQKYLWEHAVSVGVLSKIISAEYSTQADPQAYVAGLLHDIGKIVLLIHDANKFRTSLKMNRGISSNFIDPEFDSFGFSHIETGYFILNKFGFSNIMKNVVLFHHNLGFAPKNNLLVWVVGFANELSYYLKDNISGDINLYLKKFNFSTDQLINIINEGNIQIESHLLDMKI